jgi:hypothetical protein
MEFFPVFLAECATMRPASVHAKSCRQQEREQGMSSETRRKRITGKPTGRAAVRPG